MSKAKPSKRYLRALQQQYHRRRKKDRGRILDGFVATTHGYPPQACHCDLGWWYYRTKQPIQRPWAPILQIAAWFDEIDSRWLRAMMDVEVEALHARGHLNVSADCWTTSAHQFLDKPSAAVTASGAWAASTWRQARLIAQKSAADSPNPIGMTSRLPLSYSSNPATSAQTLRLLPSAESGHESCCQLRTRATQLRLPLLIKVTWANESRQLRLSRASNSRLSNRRPIRWKVSGVVTSGEYFQIDLAACLSMRREEAM